MDAHYHAKLTSTPPQPPIRYLTPLGPPIQDKKAQLPPQPSTTFPAARVTVLPGEPVILENIPNINVDPLQTENLESEKRSRQTSTLGSWTFTKPHPLLWLCLALSLLALVLEVPKGSLPTFTGRHKALRVREKQLQEKLLLLKQISTLLPPPLAQLISVPSNHDRFSGRTGSRSLLMEALRISPVARLWPDKLVVRGGSDEARQSDSHSSGDRWWTFEDFGEGMHVIRTKTGSRENEVWVIHGRPNDDSADPPSSRAHAQALLLSDELLLLDHNKLGSRCAPCHCAKTDLVTAHSPQQPHDRTRFSHRNDQDASEADPSGLEERRKKQTEREKEVEARERDLIQREQWVVNEMRKMSDKARLQATELAMEERIIERLKTYQPHPRQVEKDDS